MLQLFSFSCFLQYVNGNTDLDPDLFDKGSNYQRYFLLILCRSIDIRTMNIKKIRKSTGSQNNTFPHHTSVPSL